MGQVLIILVDMKGRPNGICSNEERRGGMNTGRNSTRSIALHLIHNSRPISQPWATAKTLTRFDILRVNVNGRWHGMTVSGVLGFF